MDNGMGRRALNCVRLVSDTTPLTLLTASRDNGVAAAIVVEMEWFDPKTGNRAGITAASFFWDDMVRFAEALLVIVSDAKEDDQKRAEERAREEAEGGE